MVPPQRMIMVLLMVLLMTSKNFIYLQYIENGYRDKFMINLIKCLVKRYRPLLAHWYDARLVLRCPVLRSWVAPGHFAVMSDLGLHAVISQRGVGRAV